MNPFMNTFNHGKSQIKLNFPNATKHMRPIELHMREDGSLNNTPSFAMVMMNQTGTQFVVGQFSIETLTDCLDELGFTLTKKP